MLICIDYFSSYVHLYTPSANEITEGLIWNKKTNEAGWKMYLGELHGTENIPAYAAATRAEDYCNLPPTYTCVGQLDPFRSETLTYVTKLAEAGVDVEFHLIAEQLGEDPTYIRKILAKLNKVGYVKSQGGRYGGYKLHVDPKEITFKDIYCVLGDTPITPYYTVPYTGVEFLISQIIDNAEKKFQNELAGFTLDDLLIQTKK